MALPCHMIETYPNENQGCFDDVDRDGQFQYERGGAFSSICDWRLYQLKAVASQLTYSIDCD